MTKHKSKYKSGDRVLFQEPEVEECYPYSGEVISVTEESVVIRSKKLRGL